MMTVSIGAFKWMICYTQSTFISCGFYSDKKQLEF